MDWKLLLIGIAMALVGAAICFRFRRSAFMSQLAPGLAMTLGIVLLTTGLLSLLFAF